MQDLEYLRNMSCLGCEHPWVRAKMDYIETKYEIKDPRKEWITCRQKVDVWSWSTLVREFNFGGCEMLLVDAEGSDAKILRSLVQHCKTNPTHWPEMIQFETMGHCDQLEGLGAEKTVLDTLQHEGYRIVTRSSHNSIVIKASAIEKEVRWQKLAYELYCMCWRMWCMPYHETKEGILRQGCHE